MKTLNRLDGKLDISSRLLAFKANSGIEDPLLNPHKEFVITPIL